MVLDTSTLYCLGVCLDREKFEVRVFSNVCKITKGEFLLLEKLMERQGKFCSIDQLRSALSENDYPKTSLDSIPSHIKRIRNKLFKDQAAGFSFIQTLYGAGYRIPTLEQLFRDNDGVRQYKK